MTPDEALQTAIRWLSREADMIERSATRSPDHMPAGAVDPDRFNSMMAHAQHRHTVAETLKLLQVNNDNKIQDNIAFILGFAAAQKAAALVLDKNSVLDWAPKIYHYLKNSGDCNCSWDSEGYYGNECDDFSKNAPEYFKELHGMTEEEYSKYVQEQYNERERKRIETALAAAAQRHQTLEELAVEQGVDPKLLP